MTVAKSLLLIILAMLFATPASAQTTEPPPEDDPVSSEIVGTWASPRPQRSQVQDAFDALDKCGSTDLSCVPQRTYDIHAASCMSIALHQDRLAVACRIDMTMTDTVPEPKTTHFRDHCVRLFMQPDGNWAIFNDWDRPCEMPSILTRDPHPRPERKDLGETAAATFICIPENEASDCFVQPASAVVTRSNCRAQPQGKQGEPRFVCQLTGTVRFTSGAVHPFRNLCVRVRRYSDPGQSPPFWGFDNTEGAPPCEDAYRSRR